MKSLLLLVCIACAGPGLFGQGLSASEASPPAGESPQEEFLQTERMDDAVALDEENSPEYLQGDLFDELFGDAQDVEVESQEPVTTAPAPPGEDGGKTASIFFKPLTFSGHMQAEAGVSGIFQHNDNSGTGFFLFKNQLFLSARTSKNLGIRGTLEVQYPNFAITVEELYFDYLFLDKVYISGGKKPINWGYVQLFSDLSLFDFEFNKEWNAPKKYVPTNVVSDSSSMITLHVQIPLWTGTISGVMLYPIGKTTTPKIGDFSFAGSIEMTIWSTAVNLFARKNPSADSELSQNGNYRPPVVGLELKRTVMGYDVYLQSVVGIQNMQELAGPAGYESVITTAGLYRLWDNIIPKIGFNLEYQHVLAPHGNRLHIHRTAFLGGLSSIGPQRNMKLGVTWNHEYIVNNGDLTLGFTVAGILPHADWKLGLELVYGEAYKAMPKTTLVTSLLLLLDY